MGNPALAMDDVRCPAEFLDCLKDSPCEENGPFVIVLEELSIGIEKCLFATEIVLVVNEIDLNPCGGNGCDLDDQRSVDVSDDYVHPGKSYYLVELVLPFVDATVTRHEGTYFLLALLNALRKIAAYLCEFGLREIWIYLGIDEQYSMCIFAHLHKDKKFFRIFVVEMAREENKIVRKRLVNAYLSSIISISLVLLLVGVASLLILNARNVADYFKENMQVSVMLKQEVSESKAETFRASIEEYPFINSTRLVSKEEGAEEMKAMLGEDFLSVFESSPIPISIDVTLKADYVSADSLDMVIGKLSESNLVDEVGCQQSLVEALNSNLTKISFILGIFIALMLFISFVLINNTVRLNVFSQRFTIHTMRLVGATKAFIRKPFLVRAVYQGLISSAVAILILGGLLIFVKKSFEQLFEIFRTDIMVAGAVIVIACGVLICVASTFFVVNRLISMSKDELYI